MSVGWAVSRANDIRPFLRFITSELTRHQRIVCARWWFDGWDYARMRAELGMTRNAVRKLLKRVKQKLAAAGLPVPMQPHKRRIGVPIVQLSVAGANAA